jgi:MOSC domain-containing protein YiiM
MRVLSVNVGKPRVVELPHGAVLTSIFKSPVEGRRAVRKHNIDGDQQSDLSVHGGPNKAIYCYPHEHYAWWKEHLPEVEFPFGAFGENLTTEGLLEQDVRIGDRFRVGSAVLQVTQPRMPCFKLNVRFERYDMVKMFWASGRAGIYFCIVEEGDVGAGDILEKIAAGPEEVTVKDVVRLYRGDEKSDELFARAMRAPVAGSWKEEIRERRAQAGA